MQPTNFRPEELPRRATLFVLAAWDGRPWQRGTVYSFMGWIGSYKEDSTIIVSLLVYSQLNKKLTGRSLTNRIKFFVGLFFDTKFYRKPLVFLGR